MKNRLVLVVRVPLTDGEILPVPLISTGGRSALTPASADNRCVKLRVEVGTSVNSSALSRRYVAAVFATTTGASAGLGANCMYPASGSSGYPPPSLNVPRHRRLSMTVVGSASGVTRTPNAVCVSPVAGSL